MKSSWAGARIWALGAFFCSLLPQLASAAPPPVPSQVQPGAVERTLKQQIPQAKGGTIEVPSPSGFGTPTGADTVHLTVKHVTITGATALPQSALEPAYKGLVGHAVTLADVFAAARAITSIYGKAGYALTFALVPAQKIDRDTGDVTIDVVEGYIADIKFEGATERLPDAIKGYGDQLKTSRPLKTDALERYLLLMDDITGYTVAAVFNRMPDAPKGATRLIVKVDHAGWAASANLNNRGSRAFGPWQVAADISESAQLGLGEHLALHGVRALDGNALSALAARADVPISDDGLSLSLASTWSDAHPKTPILSAVGFASSGWTVNATVKYPLMRSRAESLWVWGGFAAKWLRSEFVSVPRSRDHIYDLLAGATWNERDTGGLTAATVSLTQGLDIFGATTGASPLRSRSAGSGVYTAFNGQISRLQNLVSTDGGEWDLFAAASAQLSGRGLLSPEQCGYGGASFGRAFDDNEIVGDDCVMGSAEVRFTPSLPSVAGGALDQLQAFAVFDAGHVWSVGSLNPGEAQSANAFTAGLGIRATALERFTLSLEYDQPISHVVALEGNRNGRLFFSITVSN